MIKRKIKEGGCYRLIYSPSRCFSIGKKRGWFSRKFRKYDRYNRCIHLVAMNKRNVKLIQSKCDEDNKLILPLENHITPEFIQRLEEKDMIVDNFINHT